MSGFGKFTRETKRGARSAPEAPIPPPLKRATNEQSHGAALGKNPSVLTQAPRQYMPPRLKIFSLRHSASHGSGFSPELAWRLDEFERRWSACVTCLASLLDRRKPFHRREGGVGDGQSSFGELDFAVPCRGEIPKGATPRAKPYQAPRAFGLRRNQQRVPKPRAISVLGSGTASTCCCILCRLPWSR